MLRVPLVAKSTLKIKYNLNFKDTIIMYMHVHVCVYNMNMFTAVYMVFEYVHVLV